MSQGDIVFETEWFNVERLSSYVNEGQRDAPYYRINAPDGLIMLALTEKNEIILVKQFRPALGRHTIELPAGAIDPDENPAEAATRELLEETGYVCEYLTSLGEGQLYSNRLNSRLFAFLGSGATRHPSYVTKENIQPLLVSPIQMKNLILANEVEQYPALALLVLADWKAGMSLTHPEES